MTTHIVIQNQLLWNDRYTMIKKCVAWMDLASKTRHKIHKWHSIQFNFNFNFVYWLTTTTTDSIHTSNGTPFCKYSALPIHHGKFPPRSHKGHPLSGLYVEVRGANYEFIHELKKVIVFPLSNCVQYRFHLTAMYRESVAPVKQWNRFTVKIGTHTKKNMSQMHFRNV